MYKAKCKDCSYESAPLPEGIAKTAAEMHALLGHQVEVIKVN